jgi:FkbM family methyltransferase
MIKRDWAYSKLQGLIELCKLFKIKNGLYLFFQLHKKQRSYILKPSFLKSPIYLRDNFSDKAIFLQVFVERQYVPINFDFPKIETILDGGANIGLASIFFTTMFPDAEILAVEPNKSNFELLYKNTKTYNSIDCHYGAIWDKEEDIHITNPESLAAGFEVDRGAKNDNLLRGTTIQKLLGLKKWSRIDLLKLDIEGAEKEVFNAADTNWLKKIRVLIIELHDHYKPGCTKAVFKALEGYDYTAYFHNENIFIKFKHSL